MNTTNIYNITKKVLLFLSLLGLWILVDNQSYKLFGQLSRYLLIFIVFIRPLSDILPQFKFLKQIVGMRKEVGIMCATFGLAHGIGFFLMTNVGLTGFLNANYWDLGSEFGWGMLALVISIPLLITSNVFSMKLLKKHWKPLQRFTYLFFIFTAIHIAFVKPNEIISMSILVLSWMGLRTLAYKKYTFDQHKIAVSSLLLLILIGYSAGAFYTNQSSPQPNLENQNEVDISETTTSNISKETVTTTGDNTVAETTQTNIISGTTTQESNINTGNEATNTTTGTKNTTSTAAKKQTRKGQNTTATKTTIVNTTTTANTGTQTSTHTTQTVTATSSNTTTNSETKNTGVVATTSKKIHVSNGCIGCGKCARIASAYFQMSNHKAQVIKQSDTDAQVVQQAINRCPADAITLS